MFRFKSGCKKRLIIIGSVTILQIHFPALDSRKADPHSPYLGNLRHDWRPPSPLRGTLFLKDDAKRLRSHRRGGGRVPWSFFESWYQGGGWREAVAGGRSIIRVIFPLPTTPPQVQRSQVLVQLIFFPRSQLQINQYFEYFQIFIIAAFVLPTVEGIQKKNRVSERNKFRIPHEIGRLRGSVMQL